MEIKRKLKLLNSYQTKLNLNKDCKKDEHYIIIITWVI